MENDKAFYKLATLLTRLELKRERACNGLCVDCMILSKSYWRFWKLF